MDFKILLLSHGEFSKKIIESCEMIVGEVHDVEALSLMPGMSTESFLNMVKVSLNGESKEVLILTDLFGGTPSNVALMLTKTYSVSVISGLNLAMLIEAVIQRPYLAEKEFQTFINKLIQIGKDACQRVQLKEANHG